MVEDYSLCNMYRQLSFNMRLLVRRSRLNLTSPEDLLAHEWARLMVSIRMSTVCREKAANRLLAC